MVSPVNQLESVLQSIETTCNRCERSDEQINLVAVSKTFPAAAIRPLLEHGWRRYGENRVQEAQSKWPNLRQEFDGVELHLIGPLQSNKAADAVALFDVIQTIDREKIAKTVHSEMQNQGRELKLFVQVNTGLEAQKAGVDPAKAVEFVRWCQNDLQMKITGLMCIPPFDENPGPHFALLDKVADQCGVEGRSMGMSADFETGIEFGATHVRVGSAIFGARG